MISSTLNQTAMSHSQTQYFMNSTMLSNLNRSNSLNPRKLFSRAFFIRAFNSVKASKTNNLFSRISPIKQTHQVIPVLDQWVDEGRKVERLELQRIIRDLRSRKRHSQALQVSEWMKGLCSFSTGDTAVHLDLIGIVYGWEAAEQYFNQLKEQQKDEKTYGALLICYIREGLVDKSLSHFQRMKDIGCSSSHLVYNNLMSLYKNTGQLDKVPDVLSEMKSNGITPNNFSYRICLSSYGERSDINGMEKLLVEMEGQPYISMDWMTYSVVANFFIKANAKEKAVVYLKKLEKVLHKDAIGYNHLISLYAHLGNKDEMLKLWHLQKIVCKKHINRDYITMLGCLVKIGELETAETILDEWELSCHTYDFRVPNILLIGYCQKGRIEKAEEILQRIVNKGKSPTPNSWAIIAAGYADKGKMDKAIESMKQALAVREQNLAWKPKPKLVSSILSGFGDSGKLEEVEAFIESLKAVAPVNRHMYNALIKTIIREGGEVDRILESMKVDGIAQDEETKEILGLKKIVEPFS